MAIYTKKLGEKICETTATSSIGLRHICKQLKVPYSTATSWIYDPKHELCKKYKLAKEMQLHHLAEEILEIADDSTNDYMTIVKNGKSRQVQNRETIARSRLRIQARMNLISKLAPILRENKMGKYRNDDENFEIKYPPLPPGRVWPRELTPEEWEAKLGPGPDVIGDNTEDDTEPAHQKNKAGSSPKNTFKPALDEPIEKPKAEPYRGHPYRW